MVENEMVGIYTKQLQDIFAPIEHEHFWHIGRRQIILLFTPRQGKMLDIGCGNGSVTEYLKTYGIDVEGKEGIDVCNLTYNNEYDIIGLFDVLEHTSNDVEAICQCREALVAGGYLILTVPTYKKLWSYHDIYVGHKRRYSKKNLVRLLDILNFEVERVSYFTMFLLPIAFVAKKIMKQSGVPFFLKTIPIINGLLLAVMEIEILILRYRNLPFGSSLIVRARKRG